MDNIRITVLMPCYNAADYIADAIRSVLAQTFRDFELLIINDGSNDGTDDIIKSFDDPRIVVIRQPQQGIATALNNGLNHARAGYIARFDADDICFPHRLEKQYDFITANPDYIIVGSAADYIDHAGNYIFTHHPRAVSNDEIQRLAYMVCPFIHAGVLYQKDIISRIGYDINAHSFEDHLLWLQLKPEGKMYNIPESLLKVRLNSASLTIDEKKRPKDFRRIKQKALKAKHISAADGNMLEAIIRRQNNDKEKEGAYYSLLAKKFLWNNYDPLKARYNIKKAITYGTFDIKDYLLIPVSYLPKRIITNLYSIFAAGK